MNEMPDDLSTLAARDPEGSEDRVVNAVMRRIRSAKFQSSSASAISPFDDALATVVRFALPIAAAAAIVALGSLSIAARRISVDSESPELQPSAALALGVPPRVALWALQGEVLPSSAEVILAMREGGQ